MIRSLNGKYFIIALLLKKVKTKALWYNDHGVFMFQRKVSSNIIMKYRKILKNKLFLYLTEFISGIAVMAIELGASRLLSPYFSSSQIVWTIIIGTIMIAMALGNVFGGRSADKDPDPDILYRRLIIAGIWTALIPVLGKYVILGISGLIILAVDQNYLIWAAFASCFIIFVFPLFLLGTVSPCLVKYSTDSLEDNGRTVGYLYASNTIGSIIGTFLPTFVTIPEVGTSITFLIFAGLLTAVSLVYFLSEKTAKKNIAFSGIAVFILCISCIFGRSTSFAFWENDLTLEDESVYNYLQVRDDDRATYLSTNVLFGVQSMKVKDGSLTGMYYDYAMAAPFMTDVFSHNNEDNDPENKRSGTGSTEDTEGSTRYHKDNIEEPKSDTRYLKDRYKGNDRLKVLILGNGSGTYATELKRYFNNADIEGVEIDQKITDLARDYFQMPDDVKVTTYDGRAYLNAVEKKYNVIMVDAYQDISVPFQMSSKEFFTEVKDHLDRDGVMVINMNMRGEGEGNINQYLSDTISTVFDTVCTIDVPAGTNRELFASDNKDILSLLGDNIRSLDRAVDTGIYPDAMDPACFSAPKGSAKELAGLLGDLKSNLSPYAAGSHILTDDKAPVEVLSMRALDGIIRNEVSFYKDIYHKEGLKGLLEQLT